jgi:hypothetical protein
MIAPRWLAALLLCATLALPGTAGAQSVVNSTSPTLAELLKNIYGPNGLIVDSQALLPDGSTHSAHFNGAFQSEFERFNIALVRQLVALPLPSPAAGFTYKFDASTGTFARTTQSFGPILADRADTIGRGKFVFGYSLQQFDFHSFDGLPLSHVPAVFTHDDAQLGGGRADIITTDSAIAASVTQSTTFITFGVTDRLDVSLAVPLIRTSIDVLSHATIQRIGTGTSPATHFFEDPNAPGGFGNQRTFIAQGSAQGVGDLIVRGKGTVWESPAAGVAVGVDLRLPTGEEENLLGSGSLGVKLFEATSFTVGALSPHVGLAYQWNGATVLAGDIATGTKGNLPSEVQYNVGGDVSVDRRLTLAFDVLGRHSTGSPRLRSSPFTSQGAAPLVYPNIAFTLQTLNVLNGSVGMKVNVARTLLFTFNTLFRLNDAGLTTKLTPLVGLEYGF